jgi:hypothetical protein
MLTTLVPGSAPGRTPLMTLMTSMMSMPPRVALLILVLTGCGTVATPISPGLSGEIRSTKTVSYVIGEPAKAYVGEPLVARKIYFSRAGRNAYKADRDFVIGGGILRATVNARGQAGVPYPVIGKVSFGGSEIDAIDVPGGNPVQLIYGITKDGRLAGVVAGWSSGTSPMVGVNQYHIDPVDVLFTRAESSQIVLENYPYENFEILYSGTSAGSIRLLYREYTRHDLVRPGFSQELNYPADVKQIRFKGMLIEILSISADGIDFRVIE